MGIIQSVCQGSLQVPKTFISDYHVDILLESVLGLENQDIAIIEHCSPHQVDEVFDQCNHFIAHELVDFSSTNSLAKDSSLDHIFDVFGDSSQIACYATLKHHDIKKCMEEYLNDLQSQEDAMKASESDEVGSKGKASKGAKKAIDTKRVKAAKRSFTLDLEGDSLTTDDTFKVDTEKIEHKSWFFNTESQTIKNLDELKSKCCSHLNEVLHKYCEYRHCSTIEEQLKNECYLLDVIPANSVFEPQKAVHSRFVKYTHWDNHTPYQSNGSVVLDMYSALDTNKASDEQPCINDIDRQYIYEHIRSIRDEAQQELERISAKRRRTRHCHGGKYSISAEVQREIDRISALGDELQHELERISALRHGVENGQNCSMVTSDLHEHAQDSLHSSSNIELSKVKSHGFAQVASDLELDDFSSAGDAYDLNLDCIGLADDTSDRMLDELSCAGDASENELDNLSFISEEEVSKDEQSLVSSQYNKVAKDNSHEADSCHSADSIHEADSSCGADSSYESDCSHGADCSHEAASRDLGADEAVDNVKSGTCSTKRCAFQNTDIDAILANDHGLASNGGAQCASKKQASKNAKAMLEDKSLTNSTKAPIFLDKPERIKSSEELERFNSLEELIQYKKSSEHRRVKMRLRHFVSDERYQYFAECSNVKRGFEKGSSSNKE
ncbi:hypothetical protein [uncultured Anaerobiospirillum sp.]|uniref:hypothetical protein n=1 Tax=uncultured Anaerobiospirillum sp. TaxID=265728 RepID=UPI0028062C0E|nr:hypothetical protein [uncultured Anaerobiospirillum sp.]